MLKNGLEIRDWSRVNGRHHLGQEVTEVGGAGSGKEGSGVCSGQPGVSLEALEQGSDMSGMHTGRLEGS